jgi:hypothetical protein
MEMASGGGDNSCCHPKPLTPMPTPEEWEASIRANRGKIPKARAGTSLDQWSQALANSHGKVPQYSEK